MEAVIKLQPLIASLLALAAVVGGAVTQSLNNPDRDAGMFWKERSTLK
jgi:hypothetical protein